MSDQEVQTQVETQDQQTSTWGQLEQDQQQTSTWEQPNQDQQQTPEQTEVDNSRYDVYHD